ncbi:hypothetical protein BDN71DRAFT_1436405 [Pleurotus eryngii]|uniref:Uncharacterized protein n=1 Tax=Pleurotus eryngii TaxID=5323 RepID=A0A9P6D0V6_PLEER|nr:hypothetical protein BDN71DRAFT_1436405 [Pleurotus eryngii]
MPGWCQHCTPMACFKITEQPGYSSTYKHVAVVLSLTGSQISHLLRHSTATLKATYSMSLILMARILMLRSISASQKRLEAMQLQLVALVVDKDNAAQENTTLVMENMDKHGDWCTLLCRKQEEGRVDALKYIKRSAPSIFKDYGIPASDWTSSTTRANSTIIQSLLKFLGNKNYPEVPPLIYLGLNMDTRKVFCNPILGRCRCQVITAVHVLSSDTLLNEMGLMSLIPYRMYYYKLKSTLVLHTNAPTHSQSIFHTSQHRQSQINLVFTPFVMPFAISTVQTMTKNDNNTSGSANLPRTLRPLTIEYEMFDLAQVIDSRSDSEPISPAVVESTPELQPAHEQPSRQGKKKASHRGG